VPETDAVPSEVVVVVTTATLVTIAHCETALVILGAMPEVGAHGDAEQFPTTSGVPTEATFPVTGVGGLLIVTVTVEVLDAVKFGPVAV
jgi:hypothetical protein